MEVVLMDIKIKYFDSENISQHGEWIDLRSTVDVALEKEVDLFI